jgi:hypothetical protein
MSKFRPAEEIAGKRAVRNFYGMIVHRDQEGGPSQALTGGDKFAPERSYFSVRVVEMRLAEASRYFTEFIPMCSCFLRFTYGRNQRTVPFVLGSETISTKLAADVPKDVPNVSFGNEYIVRNVPVKADNLSMYAALCRFKDAGYARGLVNLLSDAATVVGGPAMGTIVKTGADLTSRLGTLLGADDVDTRFGVFTGNALNASGYHVFAGTPDATLNAEDLAMQDGKLVRRVSGSPDAGIDNIDYLVIGMEYRASLLDENFGQVSILPFHARWDEVRTRLLRADHSGALETLKDLLIEISVSPDVTEADRVGLIASYQGEFEKWKAVGRNGPRLMAALPISVDPRRLSSSPTVKAIFDAMRIGTLKSNRDAGDVSQAALEDADAVRQSMARRAMTTAEEIRAPLSRLAPEEMRKVTTGFLSGALAVN